MKNILKNSRHFLNFGLALLFTLASNFSLITILTPSAAYADSGIISIGKIGGYESPSLDFPNGIVVDDGGGLYVVDKDNDSIKKYDSNFEYEFRFGDGEFNHPLNLAIDSVGNLYVTDGSSHLVKKFDSTGNFISEWGSSGSGNGEFNWPDGISVDASDVIYVVDSHNDRIQKFDTDGLYLGQIGTLGTGDGQFDNPQNIAFDSAGNFYVTDGDNDRIQKFDSTGNFISEWGSSGSGNGEFNGVYGISIDASNNVYVTDSDNNRVQKFSSTGTYLAQFGSFGTENGEFNYPRGIVVDSANNIFVADSENDRIQKFDANGNYASTSVNDTGNPIRSFGLATDSNGKLYLGNIPGNDEVGILDATLDTYSPDGTKLSSWSSQDGGYITLTTSPSHIYALTYGMSGPKINKLDYAGDLITQWDIALSGPGLLAVDSQENVYLTDPEGDQILKYDGAGNLLAQWGTSGSEDGEFGSPYGITVDTNDNVYVADTSNNRIQKFDSSGNFIGKWGSSGSGNGQFDRPYGITVDTNDNVYVADTSNNRIQKFGTNGIYLDQYNQGPDEMTGYPFLPTTIAAGQNGRLFVGASPFFNSDFTGRIEILCDNDVSDSGCIDEDGSQGGNGSNTATLQNAHNGTPVVVTTPTGTSITCSSALKETSLTEQDGAYGYPLGLIEFCFDTNQQNNEVSLTFVTDLKPSQVIARKYNSTNQTYFNISGATITETTYQGQHALKLTYTIADNGQLDLDSATGKIKDPVGLAVATDSLANTGSNTIHLYALALLIFATSMFLFRKTREEQSLLA